MMMSKKMYRAPGVLKTVTVLLEKDLLAGSVVNKNTKVQTKGQEVVSYDFSDGTTFNQTWE